MQRLEVSGEVRPIYGSLGVKRLIWNPQRFVTLGYVGRWKSHEEVHSALHRPLYILLYNFTSSFDGLNWTFYTEYITVSEIIVIC